MIVDLKDPSCLVIPSLPVEEQIGWSRGCKICRESTHETLHPCSFLYSKVFLLLFSMFRLKCTLWVRDGCLERLNLCHTTSRVLDEWFEGSACLSDAYLCIFVSFSCSVFEEQIPPVAWRWWSEGWREDKKKRRKRGGGALPRNPYGS